MSKVWFTVYSRTRAAHGFNRGCRVVLSAAGCRCGGGWLLSVWWWLRNISSTQHTARSTQHAAHSTQHTANNTTARAHRPPCMVVNFQEPSRDLPHAIMCFLQVGVFAEQCPCLACWRGCGRARCAGEAAGGGDQGCTPCCCIWALQRLQAAAICRLAPARPPRRAVPA